MYVCMYLCSFWKYIYLFVTGGSIYFWKCTIYFLHKQLQQLWLKQEGRYKFYKDTMLVYKYI